MSKKEAPKAPPRGAGGKFQSQKPAVKTAPAKKAAAAAPQKGKKGR